MYIGNILSTSILLLLLIFHSDCTRSNNEKDDQPRCHPICRCDKRQIKLTCNDVTLTPKDLQTFVLPSGIREISLSNNNISHLSAQLLRKFRGLLKFQLTNNLLFNISSGTFTEFDNLTTLVLTRNRIRNIDGDEFIGLSKLETLDLSGNYLETLHAGMFNQLPSIASIKLRYNSIRVIPNGVFTPLTTLQKLFVSNNEITHLEDRAFQNLSMNKLDFTNNKITKLSRSTFLNFKTVYKIMLLFNNFDCGCKQAMIYAKYFKDLKKSVYARCSTPLESEGKAILSAYVGTQCTLCDLNMCSNGAGCQGNKTHFTCMCAEQFKGKFCERNICKPVIKYVNRYVQLPDTKVTKDIVDNSTNTRTVVVGKHVGGGDPVSATEQLEAENRELETKLLILYAICSIELVIILCFVGLLILGKYQDWRLMKKYNMDKKSPHILEKFQWTPASEIENLNGKGYISIREVIPYKI